MRRNESAPNLSLRGIPSSPLGLRGQVYLRKLQKRGLFLKNILASPPPPKISLVSSWKIIFLLFYYKGFCFVLFCFYSNGTLRLTGTLRPKPLLALGDETVQAPGRDAGTPGPPRCWRILQVQRRHRDVLNGTQVVNRKLDFDIGDKAFRTLAGMWAEKNHFPLK